MWYMPTMGEFVLHPIMIINTNTLFYNIGATVFYSEMDSKLFSHHKNLINQLVNEWSDYFKRSSLPTFGSG